MFYCNQTEDECLPFLCQENAEIRCNFVRKTSVCQVDGFIQYLPAVFCWFPLGFEWVPTFLFALFLVILFIGLSTAADSFFCPNLSTIVNHLGISQNIAGVTFLAFGNGAPDIFSSLAASAKVIGNPKNAGLMFGSLIGAGVFVTTIVFGTIALLSPFDLMQRPFLRDLIFYLATLYWTFFLLFKQRIYLLEAAGFLILYLFYVAVVIVGRIIRKRILEKPPNIRKEEPVVPSVSVTSSSAAINPSDILPNLHDAELPVAARKSGGTQLRKIDSIIEESLWHYEVHAPNSEAPNEFFEEKNSTNRENEEEDENSDDLIEIRSGRRTDFRRIFYRFSIAIWFGVRPFTFGQWKESKCHQKLYFLLQAPVKFLLALTIPTVDFDAPHQNWNQPLLLLQSIVCPLLTVLVLHYESFLIAYIIPLPLVVFLISFALMLILLQLTSLKIPPRFHEFFAYAGFFMSVLWIYAIANEIVNILLMMGIVMGVSLELLGLTLLAWANSLSDFVANVSVARQGFPRMAVSACFGGPLFNLLVGVGTSFTIACAKTPDHVIRFEPFNSVQKLLCIFLGISLLSSFVFLPFQKFRANRSYGIFLIILYVIFILFVILAEFGQIYF